MLSAGLWWAYALLGVVAGAFGAALGVGGGIIMVPALVLLFQVPQKMAQGTSLAAMVLMALAASFRYWADPATRMDLRIAGLISVFAIAGAFLGAEIARHVSANVLQKAFAVVLVIAAVRLAFFAPADRPAGRNRPAAVERSARGQPPAP